MNNTRDWAAGSSNKIIKEAGDRLYRKDLINHTCLQFYEEYSTCYECPKSVINLNSIDKTTYKSGKRIIWCVKNYGWDVVRGMTMSDVTTILITEASG